MKQFISALFIAFIALTAYAQKDVTKFMGIPVDGTKAEMIQKLKAKGFTSSRYDRDILEGEFNGHDAKIFVQTNRNKVWRIIVSYDNLSEQNAKDRFNSLCDQFSKSSKYYSSPGNYTIPETDDISYEISVNEKRYEAGFFQRVESDLTKNDFSTFLGDSYIDENKCVWFLIFQKTPLDYSIVIYYENRNNRSNGEDL